MCKASIDARETRNAIEGDILKLEQAPGGLPAFFEEGGSPDCVTCVQDGQKLTLVGIPGVLQKEFSVSHTEIVTFVETSGEAADEVRFSNRKILDLFQFFSFASGYATPYNVQIVVGEALGMDISSFSSTVIEGEFEHAA